MQTAAQAGAFFSRDPSDNKTVELWARWALRGAQHAVQRGAPAGSSAGVAEKPKILTLLGTILCKLILEHDAFDALPSVVGCFKDLAALGVEVPAAARFLEELATFDLAGDTEFSQEGLSLAAFSYLLSSPPVLELPSTTPPRALRASARSHWRGSPPAPR